MKNLMIIVCMFAIIAAVHGFNSERYAKFHMNMYKCSKEWNEKYIENSSGINRASLFRCACSKDGEVFDQYGQFMLRATIKLFEDIFDKKESVTNATDLFISCYKDFKGTPGYEGSYDISKCASSILLLLT